MSSITSRACSRARLSALRSHSRTAASSAVGDSSGRVPWVSAGMPHRIDGQRSAISAGVPWLSAGVPHRID
eukprot:9025975-Pyramimonas_sp.AAC.1